MPYGDTPTPKRFGTVSALDPELFSSVEEHAAELLAGSTNGKYSPVEVAQFFDDSCAKAVQALEAAAAAVPSRSDPAFRRWFCPAYHSYPGRQQAPVAAGFAASNLRSVRMNVHAPLPLAVAVPSSVAPS